VVLHPQRHLPGSWEVILGRGSSIESFPLFGYDLADYEQLLAACSEHLQVLNDLLRDGFGRADVEGAVRPGVVST
jgi:hypothetical protein